MPDASGSGTVLLSALDAELKRAMSSLGTDGAAAQQPKPYFLSYAVDDATTVNIAAEYGAIVNSNQSRVRSVDVQVRQAYSSLVEAWELVQASAKTIDQAQEALRLANVRYGVGTATQLDVLTSQVALTEARLNELQAGYGYNVALATLRQAMGQADEFVTS